MIGRITRIISNDYTVRYEDGSGDICKARGIFRKNKIILKVGDFVRVDTEKKIIEEVLDRKNELIRPPVSNVDIALVVISAKEPDFSSYLLDKMINIIQFNNIEPVICISKYDLLEDTSYIDEIIKYYKEIGYRIYINTNLNEIKKIFRSRVTILTGQTGVGKSSLINKLEKKMDLKTNEISKALGRGKHTTRHIELYDLFYGYVADTPGFSSIDFIGMKNEDIRDNFIEFNLYKHKCKYKDCMHYNEENCEVKKRVKKGNILMSRYENYIKFLK